uniref:Uncharacterized protein n=1 Tax=Arundo donax TaxID=35708 RepID=A0A0A9GQB4_ARUDO
MLGWTAPEDRATVAKMVLGNSLRRSSEHWSLISGLLGSLIQCRWYSYSLFLTTLMLRINS